MDPTRVRGVAVAALYVVLGAAAEAQPAEHKATVDRLHGLARLPPIAWRLHPADITHGEAVELDDASWRRAEGRVAWKGSGSWFRYALVVPKLVDGYQLAGARLRLELESEGEVMLFVNGARVAMGEALEPTVLVENARPGERLVIAVKVLDRSSENHIFRGTVWIEAAPRRPDPLTLAQELESADRLVTLAEDRPAREGQVQAAYDAIRFEALARADQAAFDRSLRDAHARLAPLRELFQRYSIRATGNAHIDMAWLWPSTETVDVVRRTFATALQLMNEYPDYTFTQSSAQAYAWLEEKYPTLFEEIRQRVREGRWELVGGMWVEPDLNMPDGESIVRQLLVGKRYFQSRFGKDIRIGWNPDSFGYSWQLPQIYRKSGIDFFVTQKLYWNDTTKFPHKVFWWEAPDGSRVLTYFPHDYVNFLDPVRMAQDVADYVPAQKGYSEILHLYGIGDHGGGPTSFMFDRGKKWASSAVVYPKLVYGTAQGFFDALEKQAPKLNLPVWTSELYLEYHRGVFTTQAATKRNNRRSEELLVGAEKLAALAMLWGLAYPAADLEHAWKRVLFNQFHDIAAGSGIAAIYRDADRDYAEVRRIGEEAMAAAFGALASHVDTRGDGIPVLVWNPLGWTRTGVVEVDVQLANAATSLHVRDRKGGKAIPIQVLEKRSPNRYRILFQANHVPALGYKVFHVVPGPAQPGPMALRADGTTLENELLRVTVDTKSGCIVSLFDKRANREALSPGSCGNLLQAFRDQPKDWDAWNIDADFEAKRWELDRADEVRLLESGPVRAAIRVVRKFQASTFSQDLTLYAGMPRLDIVTDVDWHEKHILVKAAVAVPVQTEIATFEIPYGAIARPTTRRTPEEKAKFEVPALRWADLSDATFGVSLLNDSKYGYDAAGNVLRLSLLRSPQWPDPHADEGRHHFTYSIYSHAGDWKRGGTMRQGYEANDRLMARAVPSHVGDLPAELSFLRIEPANLVLTAVKKAEADDGLVLRFFEFEGRRGDATLTFAHDLARAVETDLMEKEGGGLALKGRELRVAVAPYEIKTIKITFTGAGHAPSQ